MKDAWEFCTKTEVKSPDTENSGAGAKAWRDRETKLRFGKSKWGAM